MPLTHVLPKWYVIINYNPLLRAAGKIQYNTRLRLSNCICWKPDKPCIKISISAECCVIIESHNLLLILLSLHITPTDTVRCHGNGVLLMLYISCNCNCNGFLFIHSYTYVLFTVKMCVVYLHIYDLTTQRDVN